MEAPGGDGAQRTASPSPLERAFVFGKDSASTPVGFGFISPSASPEPKTIFGGCVSSPTVSLVPQFGATQGEVPGGGRSPLQLAPSPSIDGPGGHAFVFGGAQPPQPSGPSPVRSAERTMKKGTRSAGTRSSAQNSPQQNVSPSVAQTSSSLSPFRPHTDSPFSPSPAVQFTASASSSTASPPPFLFSGTSDSPSSLAAPSAKGKQKLKHEDDTPIQGEKGASKSRHSHIGHRDNKPGFTFSAPNVSPTTAAGADGGRKIVRARREKAHWKVEESAPDKPLKPEIAARRMVKVRRGAAKAQMGQPEGQAYERTCLRHSDLFLRHNIGGSTKNVPMPDSFVIKGYTPNGKYLLTYHSHGGLRNRMWYLWREDDTLKAMHDMKWYGQLPGELLFLTNEYIVFMLPGEDNHPAIVQYPLLDKDLALRRDLSSERGRIKLHTHSDLHPLEICKYQGAQVVFAGLLDELGSMGVVVITGTQIDADLVTTFQINPTGLAELGVTRLPPGAYSSLSHVAVHSFPKAHHFVISNDRAQDPQYQTVLFALHPPSIKEPFITVSHRSLAEDDRKYLAALEPRIKLLNLAGEVLHISHPTRAVDIISEDVSSASASAQASFSLEDFLEFAETPYSDYRERASDSDDADYEDDDDDDDDDDDENDEIAEHYTEDDFYASSGRGENVEGTFAMMSLMSRSSGPRASEEKGSDPFEDNVD